MRIRPELIAFTKLLSETRSKGATMVEYVLLASLLVIVVITAMTYMGQETSKLFHEDDIRKAFGGAAP